MHNVTFYQDGQEGKLAKAQMTDDAVLPHSIIHVYTHGDSHIFICSSELFNNECGNCWRTISQDWTGCSRR